MIKLQDNQVIYKEESINLSDLNVVEGVLSLTTSEGIVCIPEEDCTANEQEVFNAWRELYPDRIPADESPVPNPLFEPVDESPVPNPLFEPVDETINALIDAVLMLSDRLAILEGGM